MVSLWDVLYRKHPLSFEEPITYMRVHDTRLFILAETWSRLTTMLAGRFSELSISSRLKASRITLLVSTVLCNNLGLHGLTALSSQCDLAI